MNGMIVVAGAEHAHAMASIHHACFGADAWPAASIAALFESPLVFGLLSERGALAIARAVADEAELLTIGVVPASRRHGLARLLLNEVSAEACRRGANILFLEVAAANHPALSLYRAAGFVETGRRHDYYGAGLDALLLNRALCE